MKDTHALRQARERRGWSQAKVARLLDTGAKNVGRWERGETVPSPYFRERLCRLFEADAEALGFVEASPSLPVPLFASSSQMTMPHKPLLDPARPRLMVPLNQIVGRQELLTEVLDALESTTGCVLSGLPGVGKTTLAQLVTLDARCSHLFPDGLLWISLGPHPDVNGELLRLATLFQTLGDGHRQAAGSIAALSQYLHQHLGERHMLIVVDDVWSVEAVRPFLVGGSHTHHLITTRLPEVALSLSTHSVLAVPELDREQSYTLLTTLVPHLIERENEAVQRLLHATGGLPLAVTLMGHYIRVRSSGGQRRRLNDALAHLADAPTRLQVPALHSPAMETPLTLERVIALSDQHLPFEAQRALRALSVLPAKPDTFSETAALEVCEQGVEVLDLLLDAGLLEGASEGRYSLHQTIAAYARMHLQDPQPWLRLVRYALHLSDTAKKMMDYALFEQEHTTLLAALDATVAHGWADEQVQLTSRLRRFWLMAGHHALARERITAALLLARQLGDRQEEGWMRHMLGVLTDMQSHTQAAQRQFEEGLAFVRSFIKPDEYLEGAFLNSLGVVMVKQGKLRQAKIAYEEALHLVRQLKRAYEISMSLGNVGAIALYQGQVQQARNAFQEGLEILPAADSPQRGQLWVHLGSLAVFIGHYDEARHAYQQALAVAGGPIIQCQIYLGLGTVALRVRNWQEAQTWLLKGQSLSDEIGLEELRVEALTSRAELAQREKRLGEAESLLGDALALAQRLGYRLDTARVQLVLGLLRLEQRRLDEASHLFGEAASLLGEEEIALEAEIVYGQAQLAAAHARWQEAERLGRQALTHLEAMTHWRTPVVRAWIEQLRHKVLSSNSNGDETVGSYALPRV